MATTQRHKVFVSYHHCYDEKYKRAFCEALGTDIVDKSVEDGDVDISLKTDTIRQKIRDEFIADATVTVVLIGQCTWQRKHVDWEIGSSLRETLKNSRCGLLGLLLPDHFDFDTRQYRRNLIPPRLADNSSGDNAFAAIYDWPIPWNTDRVRNWIHRAFQRRASRTPVNTRKQFARNRSGRCGDGWSD
ncbi:MAG: TIR domain-containing protein [Candidatus Poribacteria bacterium]|nr:TIR domain-containing protein [Candidatus Poribacteria bacterium]